MEQVDQRIFLVIDLLKDSGQIKFYADFYRPIEISKTHFSMIKTGKAHFTVAHIEKIIKVFGVNANWIYGVSTAMFLADSYTKSYTIGPKKV